MELNFFKSPLIGSSWSDNVNVSWTFRLLIALSLVTLLRHYIGPKAICVTPPTSAEQFNKYVDETCWNSRELIYEHNFVPFHNRDVEKLPLIQNENRMFKQREIMRSVYQWLPLVLVIQAFLFLFPEVVIRCLDNCNGRQFSRFIDIFSLYSKMTAVEKKDMIQFVSDCLNDLNKNRPCGIMKTCPIAKLVGIRKILILLNAVTQLVLLDIFLCSNYSSNFYIGHVFHTFGNFSISSFPSQIQCLIYVRQPQHLQTFSVQCAVPINEFFEQVCLCVWIWLLCLCFLSLCSLCFFIFKACNAKYKQRFVKFYLRMANLQNGSSEIDLGYDVILLLDLISNLVSDILVCEVIERLLNTNYKLIDNANGPSFITIDLKNGLSKSSDTETKSSFSSSIGSTPELTPLIDRRFE